MFEQNILKNKLRMGLFLLHWVRQYFAYVANSKDRSVKGGSYTGVQKGVKEVDTRQVDWHTIV